MTLFYGSEEKQSECKQAGYTQDWRGQLPFALFFRLCCCVLLGLTLGPGMAFYRGKKGSSENLSKDLLADPG